MSAVNTMDQPTFEKLKQLLEDVGKSVKGSKEELRSFSQKQGEERQEMMAWRKTVDDRLGAAVQLVDDLKKAQKMAPNAGISDLTPKDLKKIYGTPFSPEFRQWFNESFYQGWRDARNAQEASALVQKALVGDAGSGAVLVPDEYGREVHRLIPDVSLFRPRVTVRPTGTDTYHINRLTTSSTVAVVGQGVQFPYNDPTLAGVTLTLRKYGDIILYSQELLEDSEADLTALLEDDLIGAMALFEDRQIVDGDGTNASIATGILRDPGVQVVVMGAAGGAFNPTYDELVDATAVIDSRVELTPGGLVWVFSRTTWAKIRKLKDADGMPIFDRDPTLESKGLIHGIPVLVSEAMPNSTAGLNKVFAFVGAMKHFVFAERTRLEIAVSTEFKFDTAQIALRVHARAAGGIAEPRAFTVLKGSAA